MPAIGRIANFSSLRKHRPMENQIYDSYFGAHDANTVSVCMVGSHKIPVLSVVTQTLTVSVTCDLVGLMLGRLKTEKQILL